MGPHAPRDPCVLRRDGRAFISEWMGFKDAIETLIREGLLPKDTVYGAVEVHKTSAEGCRLVEDSHGQPLRNPSIGSWSYTDPKEGIVCTTGFPSHERDGHADHGAHRGG